MLRRVCIMFTTKTIILPYQLHAYFVQWTAKYCLPQRLPAANKHANTQTQRLLHTYFYSSKQTQDANGVYPALIATNNGSMLGAHTVAWLIENTFLHQCITAHTFIGFYPFFRQLTELRFFFFAITLGDIFSHQLQTVVVRSCVLMWLYSYGCAFVGVSEAYLCVNPCIFLLRVSALACYALFLRIAAQSCAGFTFC